MAITFTNNWKNILDKLESILRAEFKGSLPVYKGKRQPAGTQYIQLIPVSSELLEYGINSETRDFTLQILFYFLDANMKDASLDQVLRIVSRVEALIHDNISMTLADSSTAFNCRLSTTQLNTDEDGEMYVVEWEYKCMHVGNLD